jgi:DNA-binding MarR family transcriptional regulator
MPGMKPKNKKHHKALKQKPAPSEKEAQIVQLLLRCGQFLQRETNTVCQQFGLKQQQFTVLNEIVWQGPISQKEVCERLLFEKSNLSKIVKILMEKELIHVEVAPGDRRMTLLTETQEGVALWEACMQAFNQVSARLMALLAKDEAAGVARLLKKLEKAFRNP